MIPIISKIMESDGVYYALNEQEDVLFATSNLEIANMYYAIPKAIERQAEIINDLSQRLELLQEQYNALVIGVMHGSSSIIH